MNKIRCIGVPEHFNLPWHLAIEDGSFQQHGVTLLWNDEPKGTGAMCQSLRDGATDLAVMVTTGTIRECLKNPELTVVGTYVDTPLIWGVHAPKNCDSDILNHLHEAKFAISRFNSGSHLQAHFYASQQGITIRQDQFEIVHNLNGARKRFAEGGNILFLWEKFTTDFLVQLDEFSLLDELLPPWPCFLITARREVVENKPALVSAVLKVISESASKLMGNPQATALVSDRYDIPIHKAESWFESVKWNTDRSIHVNALQQVGETLYGLGMLESPVSMQAIEGIVTNLD